ncbi:MAG: cytoplasmic protein [Desulfobacteraceae bacterium]|nr:cytoplasmic protein [Desulfobacteraceae bacterium]
MTQFEQGQDLNFTIDINNLFREEAITDLKVASIRKLIPILPDGSDDPSRTQIFIGSTQVMTPEGPLPLQARLEADNLQEAYKEFPLAMRYALNEMVTRIEEMRKEQTTSEQDDSRIIIPGR